MQQWKRFFLTQQHTASMVDLQADCSMTKTGLDLQQKLGSTRSDVLIIMRFSFQNINWNRLLNVCRPTIHSTLLTKVRITSTISLIRVRWGLWYRFAVSLSVVSQRSLGHLWAGITDDIITHRIHLRFPGDPSHPNKILSRNQQEAVGHQLASGSTIIESSWSSIIRIFSNSLW